MAKGNTTGKPRKVRDTEAVYRSKAETERYYEQIAIIGGGIIVGLIVLVLIYALVNDYVVVPEQAITTVAGKEVKTKEFQERFRAEKWYIANEIREANDAANGNEQLLNLYLQQTLSELPTQDVLTLLQDDAAFGRYVMQNIELQALLEKEAEDRGIKVDEGLIQAQVDEYMERYTGAELTPTDVPSETPIHTATPTPLITATASDTPTPSATPTETLVPTVTGCAEGEPCATVTLAPSNTPSDTPTATPLESATPEPTSTPLDRDEIEATLEKFGDDYYKDADEVANVDEDAVRDIFYLRALRVALRDDVGKDIATTAVWADTRHILLSVVEGAAPQNPEFDLKLCETEPWLNAKVEADAAYNAILAGEPFATLAQAVSDDPGSAAKGGAYGWMDMDNGSFVDQYKEAARTTDIGEYSQPVCTQFGWHIIQVLDREIRAVSESELRQLRQTEYDTWEDDLVANADIERREDWTERVPNEPTYEDLLGDLFPSASSAQ